MLYQHVTLDRVDHAKTLELLASDQQLASRVIRFEYQNRSDEDSEMPGVVDLIISMKSLQRLIIKGRLFRDASERWLSGLELIAPFFLPTPSI